MRTLDLDQIRLGGGMPALSICSEEVMFCLAFSVFVCLIWLSVGNFVAKTTDQTFVTIFYQRCICV